jgi:hypothetical protein
MRFVPLLTGIAISLLLVSNVTADDGNILVNFSGDWNATAPDATEVSYTFSKDGTVIWHVKDENFTRLWPKGLKAKYQVSVAEPLWQIDMFEFDAAQFKGVRLKGIIQIMDDQTFKMEGQPSPRGDRPKAFGKETLVFHARKQK